MRRHDAIHRSPQVEKYTIIKLETKEALLKSASRKRSLTRTQTSSRNVRLDSRPEGPFNPGLDVVRL